MPGFLVEGYVGDESGEFAAAAAHVRRAARDGVVYVRSTLVPEDELGLHFVEAPSRETVVDALRAAAVAYDRIVEVRG